MAEVGPEVRGELGTAVRSNGVRWSVRPEHVNDGQVHPSFGGNLGGARGEVAPPVEPATAQVKS